MWLRFDSIAAFKQCSSANIARFINIAPPNLFDVASFQPYYDYPHSAASAFNLMVDFHYLQTRGFVYCFTALKRTQYIFTGSSPDGDFFCFRFRARSSVMHNCYYLLHQLYMTQLIRHWNSAHKHLNLRVFTLKNASDNIVRNSRETSPGPRKYLMSFD